METYNALQKELVNAIERGELDAFITRLNVYLARKRNSSMAWLLLARAHAAKGNNVKATECYDQVIRLGLAPTVDKLFFENEVRHFAKTNNIESLLHTINTQRGPHLAGQSGTPRSLTTKAATNTTRPGPPKPPTEVDSLVASGRKAFHAGELNKALDKALQAYQQGYKNGSTFNLLAQTLQRLSRFLEALAYLDEGLKIVEGDEQLKLLTTKAQILSAMRDWPGAAAAYQQLVDRDRRRTARRTARLQLANAYSHQGRVPEARAVLNALLEDFPQDQIALKNLAALSAPPPDMVRASDAEDEEAQTGLDVDLPDEGVERISPMLRRDVSLAEFRDEIILLKGGRPDPDDAKRLLEGAERSIGSDFGERYPLFLEAAKAFNELEEDTYDLLDFYRALTRYAMMRGGSFVSQFRRRVLSGQLDETALRQLRDSATSYYLEAIALQVGVDRKYALIPLTNHLRVQLASFYVQKRRPVDAGLFEQPFDKLFQACLNDSDDDVTRIAYETAVATGAASAYAWGRLTQLKGGPSVLSHSLDTPAKRVRPYRILGGMASREFGKDERPADVLKAAFLARREQNQQTATFFANIQQTELSIRTLSELDAQWQLFPLHRGTLLETDEGILYQGTGAILATLMPYQSRSPAEKESILFTARSSVENLLRFIDENPTRWGRVGFEPLLDQWKKAIIRIQELRLRGIEPRLDVQLEPPVFQTHKEQVVGGLRLRNIGQAAADGVVVGVELRTQDDKQPLFKIETPIHAEIAARGTLHHPLLFEQRTLERGLSEPYRLQVTVAPIFRNSQLDAIQNEFTLEVHQGQRLRDEDIPWSVGPVPPKHMFKGRLEFIEALARHIRSTERYRSYILYGLTRSGKSSILTYLAKQLDGQQIKINEQGLFCICFEWNLDEASAQGNARDMWEYMLHKRMLDPLRQRVVDGDLPEAILPPKIESDTKVRFKHWKQIIDHLHCNGFYPVFLLDELSYFRTLVDKKLLDSSFLAAIRQFALTGQASFVFAGTYDLRKLIRDPAYGITGQFVNLIEKRVSQIDERSAEELIRVMEPKLAFTDEAIAHIQQLSYQIPYFIQMLCRNCALYAVDIGRTIIGFPELETVVQILTGEIEEQEGLNVQLLTAGVFQNNMHNQTDPPEYDALFSTICALNRGRLEAQSVTYAEIQHIWSKKGVTFFQAKLAEAVQELIAREVLLAGEDENMPAYRLSVDLFRRWWAVAHRNPDLHYDQLKQEL